MLNKFKNILLVIGWALVIGGCDSQHDRPLMVGTSVWTGYAPLYLARDLNYFNEQEIRMVELTSTTQALDALRVGKLDVAGLNIDEVLNLSQQGIGVKVIWVMDVSAGADAVITHPEITSLADLAGRRIGVEQTAVGAYMLNGVLQKANLKAADVTIVPIPFDEHAAAWHSRQVDAVVTFDPVRARLLAAGGHSLFDSRSLKNQIVDVLAVREDAILCCTKKLLKLVQAQQWALDYLEQHPQQAMALIGKRSQSPVEAVANSLQGMRLPNLKENQLMFISDTTEPAKLETIIDQLSEVMLNQGLLLAPVSGKKLLDKRFVAGAKNEN